MLPCCSKGDALVAAAIPVSGWRSWPNRILTAFQWALPLATLALIPKCPMCVAAYILLFSGVGISLTAASAIRTSLIVSCTVTLAFLLYRVLRRVV